jgi:ATP-dependent DNA helicase RecQ
VQPLESTAKIEAAEAILSRYFGHSVFRTGQEQAISCLTEGRDVLAVMPTGAGKSICYQVPALMMEGLAIVISPLISLMKDQVAALTENGVSAALINSAQSPADYHNTLCGLQEGRYKILYVAPERLLNEDFLATIRRLSISMLTVDEAHCVSQWGQNFRPAYLDIAPFARALPVRPVLSAFTATATERVRTDIIEHLGLAKPQVIVTGFDRPNLYFSVRKSDSKIQDLMAWLAGAGNKSGIIYCATRRKTDEVCTRLCAQGFSATRYHAGLSDVERKQNQEDFQYDRKTVMVATNAFGMGIDKSNVGYVIHYNMPMDVESYYQEAGRAGRDGSPADCILYYSGQDVRLAHFLIEKSLAENPELTPETQAALLKNDEAKLKAMTIYCNTCDCLRFYLLKYFGEQTQGASCGHCMNCDTNFETADVTETAQGILSCVAYLERRNLSFGKTMIVQILCGQNNVRIREWHFDEAPIYGHLKETGAHRIYNVIEHLIAAGLLLVTGGKYPTLHLAPDARNMFTAARPILLKLPKEMPKTSRIMRPGTKQKGGFSVAETPSDEALFEKLRSLRTRLAAEAGVPPFHVFSDASLRDMCRVLPRTTAAFLNVSGVGAFKKERYGEDFVAVIRGHVSDA